MFSNATDVALKLIIRHSVRTLCSAHSTQRELDRAGERNREAWAELVRRGQSVLAQVASDETYASL